MSKIGTALIAGNQERGDLVITPNEDGTLEVSVSWQDGETVMLLARSEARHLWSWLGRELGL